jgi:hypothetical protein
VKNAPAGQVLPTKTILLVQLMGKLKLNTTHYLHFGSDDHLSQNNDIENGRAKIKLDNDSAVVMVCVVNGPAWTC